MELCCEILSVRAILLFIEIIFECTITMHVDIIWDILLLDHTLLSQQTKHINVCNHFISD